MVPFDVDEASSRLKDVAIPAIPAIPPTKNEGKGGLESKATPGIAGIAAI